MQDSCFFFLIKPVTIYGIELGQSIKFGLVELRSFDYGAIAK